MAEPLNGLDTAGLDAAKQEAEANALPEPKEPELNPRWPFRVEPFDVAFWASEILAD